MAKMFSRTDRLESVHDMRIEAGQGKLRGHVMN